MLNVFYSDDTQMLLPAKHPFPQQKYGLLRERVAQLAETLRIELAPAPAATRDELLRVHTAEYIAKVFEGDLTEQEQRAIGFPWSPQFVQRSLRSIGATLAAARSMFAGVNEGLTWGAHLAGGTHHAFADRGQGFCVFNDVAVAIRALQDDGKIERALVIDCDVHQGNGTAKLFEGDATVFTFSIHGAKNFPLKKEVSDLDVPLTDGCEDEAYLELLTPAIEQAFAAGPFDAVFYISGADPYHEDRYGRMKLTKAGLRERDRLVLTRCRVEGLPTTIVMGGGYARDVQAVAEIYAGTIEEAARQAMR